MRPCMVLVLLVPQAPEARDLVALATDRNTMTRKPNQKPIWTPRAARQTRLPWIPMARLCPWQLNPVEMCGTREPCPLLQVDRAGSTGLCWSELVRYKDASMLWHLHKGG